jgi:hypothetical protein
MVQSVEVRFIVHNLWLSLKRCRSIGRLSKHLNYTAGLRSPTKVRKPKRMMGAMQFLSAVCGDKGQACSRFGAPHFVEGVSRAPLFPRSINHADPPHFTLRVALRCELRTLCSIVACVHLLTISPYLRYELQLCIMPAQSQTLRHTPLPTFDDVVSSC